MWKECGRSVEVVWKECGSSVEGVWKECGRSVEVVRKECGRCAEGVWNLDVLYAMHQLIITLVTYIFIITSLTFLFSGQRSDSP